MVKNSISLICRLFWFNDNIGLFGYICLGYGNYYISFELKCVHRRIIICPKKNKKSDFTVYIEPADSQTLDDGWTINVKFRPSIINEDNGHTIVRGNIIISLF